MSVTVFETMAVRGGRIPLLHAHLRRLGAGAHAVGLPPVPAGLAGEAVQHARPDADHILRLAWSDAGVRWSDRTFEGPDVWRLQTVEEPHPEYPVKTEGRDAFDRALAEAQAVGADEPLLSTATGTVVEAARFAVVWIEDDVLCHPDPDLGGLPSVGLARLVAVAVEHGVEVRGAWKPVTELDGLSVGLVNAARGLVRVGTLDGASVPSHDLLAELAGRFWPDA